MIKNESPFFFDHDVTRFFVAYLPTVFRPTRLRVAFLPLLFFFVAPGFFLGGRTRRNPGAGVERSDNQLRMDEALDIIYIYNILKLII